MLFSAFVPIWALTGAGYLVARRGLLGPHAEAVLGRFVFHVAMPAALFTMIARTPLERFANTSVLAFAAGTALAMGIGALLAALLFGRGRGERTVGGMAAGYVNSANLGIPVAMQVLGDATFVAPVVLLQVLVVTPVVLTVLDGESGAGVRPGRRLAGLLALPLRNPILLAAGLGAAVSALHWRLPAELARSCELLGGAGVPTALVALGLSLHGRPPAEGRTPPAELGVLVTLKTVLQPLAAYAVGHWLLHLPAGQLRTVALFSALPTAQNAYTYAREYGIGKVLARDAVLWSTLVSMATLSVVAWVL
ncbi:AEC family transporter [Kitasatospora sp. NPDC051853]|uniref:AEC family transporter n=1 Tax=Kitasatospora sp. NPDC051853 TaxID=3364058 RepID=UPI0037B6E463